MALMLGFLIISRKFQAFSYHIPSFCSRSLFASISFNFFHFSQHYFWFILTFSETFHIAIIGFCAREQFEEENFIRIGF